MLSITANAARHIHKMLEKQGLTGGGLRVGVKAGGCSGFSYVFGWEAAPRPGDQIFESSEGGRVFVDPRSLRLLGGSELDYDTALISKGFVFNNPQARATCGCGTSFSVDEAASRQS